MGKTPEGVLNTSLRPWIKLKVFNLAEGATGPDRVFYCIQNLLPDYGSLDVLFLEYAINEAGGTMSELLLRRVMNSTSVIFLDTFTLSAGPFRSAQQYRCSCTLLRCTNIEYAGCTMAQFIG